MSLLKKKEQLSPDIFDSSKMVVLDADDSLDKAYSYSGYGAMTNKFSTLSTENEYIPLIAPFITKRVWCREYFEYDFPKSANSHSFLINANTGTTYNEFFDLFKSSTVPVRFAPQSLAQRGDYLYVFKGMITLRRFLGSYGGSQDILLMVAIKQESILKLRDYRTLNPEDLVIFVNPIFKEHYRPIYNRVNRDFLKKTDIEIIYGDDHLKYTDKKKSLMQLTFNKVLPVPEVDNISEMGEILKIFNSPYYL